MTSESPRPINTILAATGLSPESIGGLMLAADLAKRRNATLHVAHVIEPATKIEQDALPGIMEEHKKIATEELTKFCKDHGVDDSATLHVLVGDPESELLKLRASLKADCLVVGRYGKGGLKRGRLGSIANRLVRKCQVSVLVAHPEFRGPVTRIGVACDFHEESQMELQRAIMLADIFDIKEVTVLSSYEVPAGYHTIMTWDEACEKLEAALRESAKSALEQANKSTEAEAPKWNLRLEEGSPTSRIPAMAKEEHLDMLVLGTHGRTRVGMVLLGRTSEKIIDGAGCSVWAEREAGRFEGFLDALKEWAE